MAVTFNPLTTSKIYHELLHHRRVYAPNINFPSCVISRCTRPTLNSELSSVEAFSIWDLLEATLTASPIHRSCRISCLSFRSTNITLALTQVSKLVPYLITSVGYGADSGILPVRPNPQVTQS